VNLGRVRPSDFLIQISDVDTVFVPQMEHNLAVVAEMVMVVETSGISVGDGIGQRGGVHLVAKRVHQMHHRLVIQVGVLCDDTVHVGLEVFVQGTLTLFVVGFNMGDRILEGFCVVGLDDFPGIFVVVEHALVG
jgi:hypothetical protein